MAIKSVTPIIRYLVSACIIQLFMMLISLPMLVMWGLPISFLSVVGNIVMTPFLILFLLIGSVIFFTELLHFPNQWFFWLYELLSAGWLWTLDKHPPCMLYGFKKPSVGLTVILVGVGTLFLYALNKHPLKRYRFMVLLFMTTTLILGNSYWYAMQSSFHTVSTGKGEIVIVRDHGTTIVIDSGYIAPLASASTWVESTLTPEIIKSTGCMQIDYLILLQPQPRVLEAIVRLFPTFTVRSIVMPLPKQMDDPRLLAFLQELERHCIKLIDNPLLRIPLTGTNACTVRQTKNSIRTGPYSYNANTLALDFNGIYTEIVPAHMSKKAKNGF